MPFYNLSNEDDLLQLIQSEVQESLYLDYKSAGDLQNNDYNKGEISKDVSSFANSDGGQIFYGIIEEGHLPKDIEGVELRTGLREWLEQVINSNIQPRISGIKIKQITLKSNPDRCVFVVDIPVSYTAHQARDKKYYKRFNFQSIAMEDFEIRQTMNRGREPILQLVITNEPLSLPIRVLHKLVGLNLFVENVGKISAKSCRYNIYLPKSIQYAHQGDWKEITDIITGIRNTVKLTLENPDAPFNQIHPDQYAEISHGARLNRIALRIPDGWASRNQVFIGYYEIIAENTIPKVGEIQFILKNSYLTIEKNEKESLPFEIF